MISNCECGGTGWVVNRNGCYIRCKCYEIERAKKLWSEYGVKQEEVKKINDYEVYNPTTEKAKRIAIKYIKSFKDNNFFKVKENWLVLMGQPGGGKTHIAVGAGAALLDMNIPTIYMPYLEVIRKLKANSMDDDYYLKIIEKYKKAKVLIIDDLFKEKIRKGILIGNINESDMKHIYPILNYRYFNHLPTIISTECDTTNLLDLDEALAGRILECCENFNITFKDNCNYRLRKYRESENYE